MAAIITENFRKTNAKRLYDALQGSTPTDTYYVGLGKNDPWPDDGNPSTFTKPVGGSYQTKDVLLNLIAMKKVDKNDVAFVLPKVNWTTGKIYKAWDPADTNCWYASGSLEPCYVISGNNLYLCVYSPGTASTTAPSSSTLGVIATVGSYKWVLLQASSSVTGSKLNTTKWYPVVNLSDSPVTTEVGKVLRVDIISGGSGYTTGQNQNLVIYGDDNGSTPRAGNLTVNVSTGSSTSITSAVVGSSNNTGFTYGNVLESDITGPGSGASFRVVVAPSAGFGGSSNFNILPLWFLGFPALFSEDGGGDWPISLTDITDYRQISLIRNPDFNTSSTGDYVLTLRSASYTGTPTAGGILKSTVAGGPTVYVDYVDSVGGKVYFHTSVSASNFNSSEIPSTGSSTFTAYTSSGTSGGSVTLSSLSEPEYERGTGEVVFFENRAPIVRSDGQTEDIKVVIQF